ncbi:hypothetical protein BJ508DRAFT_101626 [Ascobolus immersus RN42]|uniref:Uncharacterized protein n=1 Tax=Ascobolus immersus RN42 TaxID=1160509 RepID=A0A3N4H9F1_ASCIM|nr:hypothetical protein BJ508DRAFT_101626 [Ascobolus immersus RN42]
MILWGLNDNSFLFHLWGPRRILFSLYSNTHLGVFMPARFLHSGSLSSFRIPLFLHFLSNDNHDITTTKHHLCSIFCHFVSQYYESTAITIIFRQIEPRKLQNGTLTASKPPPQQPHLTSSSTLHTPRFNTAPAEMQGCHQPSANHGECTV